MDALGLPLRALVTAGPVADCTQAAELISDLPAQCLIADRGYDTDALLAYTQDLGIEAVVPPRKHRKNPQPYDAYLYKQRHRVENAFLALKSWRAIATRYAKNQNSFLATIQIGCIRQWLNIS